MSTRKRSTLAIDHGTVRTGFAVADPLRIVTTPLEAWIRRPNGPPLLDHVARLLEERDVGTFVVGLPRNMDDSEGPRAAEVRRFGAELAARFPSVVVTFVDERLSTKAAEDLMRDAGIPARAQKRHKDSFAALVLLREWVAREAT
ncbi:MAG: Holliday junction resolvase RuvX [Planctomycetes bacterium]|nr:Holliday junction resolvase RuvX [Planctomycetota bacterium]